MEIELYNPTMKQAIDSVTNDVAKRQNISKKRAKLLVLNALFYHVVINAIDDQVAFLIEEGALEIMDEVCY